VILPQDVGILLVATVLSNDCMKCEQDTSHIFGEVMLPTTIGFMIDNHVRKKDGKFRNYASINTSSVSRQYKHGCVTKPILCLQNK
jgi:hypothetical protein